MTKRLKYDLYWAQGGSAIDPDLDTTAPSYVSNRYAGLGWKSEKPPEEWQNFLTQISDEKIISLLYSGIAYWDASVTYPIGALTKFGTTGEILYTKVSAGTASQNPSVATSGWSILIDPTATGFNNLVAGLNTKLSNHLAASNPHKDTVNTLVDKSYVKTDVDNFFGSPTNPSTIVYHMLQMGQSVHGETPAQVGTLPVSGGTFTGPVVFEDDAILQVSPSQIVHLNKSTAILEIANSTVSIGIDGSGRVWIATSTGQSEVMLESNYTAMNIKTGYAFALPQPLAVIDVSGGSLSQVGCSPVQLLTTADAVFDPIKGLALSPYTLTALGINFTSVPTTAYIVGYNAAGLQSELKNSGQSEYNNLGRYLTNTTSSKFTHLKSIVIYPSLTAYQMSTLVKYVTT